jgi:hypothetical protein
MIRRVILESPYAGNVEHNVRYARLCLLDSLRRGESPIASHLLYPQVLDDLKSEERTLGIEAGLAWRHVADAMVVYTDLGKSNGVENAIMAARKIGLPVEERTLENFIL